MHVFGVSVFLFTTCSKMVGRQFTVAQRIFMVNEYIKTNSATQTKQRFRRRFPNVNAPAVKTIKRNYTKYLQHGTSQNRNKTNSGRSRTARSPHNIATVRRELNRNPRVSCRRNNTPLSKSSFNRIVRRDINYYPYHVLTRHELKNGDHAKRITFSNWLIAKPPYFVRNIVIGDEAAFYMNGKVNTHNEHMYAAKNQNPRPRYDVPNDRRKVMVWVGLVGDNTIIGPYFFDENVNGQTYGNMVNNFVVPALVQKFGQARRGSVNRVWWFQDGAPAHRTRAVHDNLQTLFPRRVIGLRHPVDWPPRSADLTLCDFFLWGYLKDRVYKTVPPSIAALRQRIRNELNRLGRTRYVRRAVSAMVRRCQTCIAKWCC